MRRPTYTPGNRQVKTWQTGSSIPKVEDQLDQSQQPETTGLSASTKPLSTIKSPPKKGFYQLKFIVAKVLKISRNSVGKIFSIQLPSLFPSKLRNPNLALRPSLSKFISSIGVFLSRNVKLLLDFLLNLLRIIQTGLKSLIGRLLSLFQHRFFRLFILFAILFPLSLFFILFSRSQNSFTLSNLSSRFLAPPIVEMILSGSIVHDGEMGVYKVPVRINIIQQGSNFLNKPGIDQVKISYGVESPQQPVDIVALDDFDSPSTRLFEVLLPESLDGKQVILKAALGRGESFTRLSFTTPPIFDIRLPGSTSDVRFDEHGRLHINVDGEISRKSGIYDYEWVITTTDSEGNIHRASIVTNRGELIIESDSSLPCIDYTITLQARNEKGTVSWTKDSQACYP